jgi:hypothetical protein
MKVTRDDLAALRFALFTLDAVLNVTTDDLHRKKISLAIARVRKVHILLLQIVSEGALDFADDVRKGIEDDSPPAKSIRLLCGDV